MLRSNLFNKISLGKLRSYFVWLYQSNTEIGFQVKNNALIDGVKYNLAKDND
jgi:hypothetical protein